MRIYISDEADPFSLHVLEVRRRPAAAATVPARSPPLRPTLSPLQVGEAEYALLRQDQDIRVDFANFPGKLVGLLDKCLACRGEDLPRCALRACSFLRGAAASCRATLLCTSVGLRLCRAGPGSDEAELPAELLTSRCNRPPRRALQVPGRAAHLGSAGAAFSIWPWRGCAGGGGAGGRCWWRAGHVPGG